MTVHANRSQPGGSAVEIEAPRHAGPKGSQMPDHAARPNGHKATSRSQPPNGAVASPLPKVKDQSADTKPTISQPGATPLPKAPRGVEAVRIETVRSSLLAAQHWLDAGTSSLKRGHGNDMKESNVVVHKTLLMAGQHLAEAEHVIFGSDTSLNTSKLAAEMDATSRSISAFVQADIAVGPMGDSELLADSEWFVRMLERETSLRALFNLPEAVNAGPRVNASASHGLDDGRSVGLVLDLVRAEAALAYAQLLDHQDRGVVGIRVSMLSKHLEHALFLLHQRSGKDDARKYASHIEAASLEVQHVRRWLAGMQNTGSASAAFEVVVYRMDELRAAAHLKPFEKLDGAVQTEGEQKQERGEKAGIEAAQGLLTIRLNKAFVGFAAGAQLFTDFAQLVRPTPPSADWLKIARDVMIAMAANLVGPAVGLLVSKLAASAGTAVTKGTLTYITKTTTDSLKKTAMAIADDATATAKSANQDIRDRELFAQGLILFQASLHADILTSVVDRIRAKEVTETELMAMAAALDVELTGIRDLAYHQAAHGFALLRARQATGVATVGTKQVSAIGSAEEYFGAQKDNLDVSINEVSGVLGVPRVPAPRAGGKVGGVGIAKLTIYIDAHGGHHMQKFDVHGMNDDMRNAILENANFRLPQLALPLEVALENPWNVTTNAGGLGSPWSWARTETPMMIIDETGALRASIAWDVLARQSALSPNIAKSFATPEQAWSVIRKTELPRSLAVITKGG